MTNCSAVTDATQRSARASSVSPSIVSSALSRPRRLLLPPAMTAPVAARALSEPAVSIRLVDAQHHLHVVGGHRARVPAWVEGDIHLDVLDAGQALQHVIRLRLDQPAQRA